MKTFATVLLVALILNLCGSRVYALAGPLDRPGISIPDGDAVVMKLHEVLSDDSREFVGGHFVNWFSTLTFAGNTEDINKLLDELSKIEGLTMSIRFQSDRGLYEQAFPSNEPHDPHPFDYQIKHEGGRSIEITIHVSKAGVDLENLRLPDMTGVSGTNADRGSPPPSQAAGDDGK